MPYVQLSRIRRPPWVRDGQALIGPGMENSRLWKKIIGKLRDPFPARLILLTATPECTQPEAFYSGPEFHQGAPGCCDGMLGTEADDNRQQPIAFLGNRPM